MLQHVQGMPSSDCPSYLRGPHSLADSNTHILELIRLSADYSKGWVGALKGDFQWLLTGSVISPPSGQFMEVVDWFAGSPKTHARAVKKDCHSDFANLNPVKVVSTDSSEPIVHLSCKNCGHLEDTHQRMQLHKFRRHGIKDSIRLYLDTTYCRFCLK